MSLQTTIRCGIKATKDGPAGSGKTVQTLQASADVRLGDGTAEGNADILFVDSRVLAASTDEEIDLTAVLKDAFGQMINFAALKAILIEADTGNTNDVVFGPANSNGFVGPFGSASDRISVGPGGRVMLAQPANGWPVTGGTGDLLNVANSGGGTEVKYKITLVGTSG